MENTPNTIEQFAYDIIYYIFLAIELVLFLRFILKLLGANPYNVFVSFLYGISSTFMFSFMNIFKSVVVQNMLFEPSILVAMVFYAIVASIVVWVIKVIG